MKLCPATRAVIVLLGALGLLCATPCSVPAQEHVQIAGRAAACSQGVRAPTQRGDDWETGTIEADSLAVEPIAALLKAICSDSFGEIHSVLLAHRGRLVFEAYFPGHVWSYEAPGFQGPPTDFGPDTQDHMQSVSKSVTALLVGMARDQGYMLDLTAGVFSFFPEYGRLSDGAKSGVTLQSLLLMASGIRWNEQDVFYGDPANDIVQLHLADDAIAYVLGKDLAHPPMTAWYYDGGGVVVVGEVLRRTSGRRLDELAQQRLFDPLGITGAQWSLLRSGVVDAPGGLKLRPRDMAKLGQLVLNGGTWRGRRIVSEDWVHAMTSPQVRFNATDGYGYYWWTRTYVTGSDSISSVRADGWGGQRIEVFPTLDLVAVFTGGNYTVARPPRLDEIVSRFIIPAARGIRK